MVKLRRALDMKHMRANKDSFVAKHRAERGAELVEADSALERRCRRSLFRHLFRHHR